MTRGLIVDPDGTLTEVEYDDVYTGLMEAFKGELIDLYRFELGMGYVDDNGFAKGLQVNPAATALYWGAKLSDGRVSLGLGEYPIVGRAVLFGPTDPIGEDTDVSDELVSLVQALTGSVLSK